MLKTPLRGFFSMTLLLGIFFAGYYAHTYNALFVVLIPIGIVLIIGLIGAIAIEYQD